MFQSNPRPPRTVSMIQTFMMRTMTWMMMKKKIIIMMMKMMTMMMIQEMGAKDHDAYSGFFPL